MSPGRAPGCPVRPLLSAWEACVQIKVQSEQAVNLSVFPGGVLTAPGNSETEPVCPLFPTERMVARDQRKLWVGRVPCLCTRGLSVCPSARSPALPSFCRATGPRARVSAEPALSLPSSLSLCLCSRALGPSLAPGSRVPSPSAPLLSYSHGFWHPHSSGLPRSFGASPSEHTPLPQAFPELTTHLEGPS